MAASGDTVRGHLYKWLDLDLLEDAQRDAKYPAELRKRIPAGLCRDQVTEAQRRLALLFEFLVIPPGDFQELAIALACREIAGFKVPKQRGRPRKKRAPPRVLLTTAQIVQKFGVTGRGRRIPVIPAPAIVLSADKWLDEQWNRTGRRPKDADWARFVAGEEARAKNLSGWRSDQYVQKRVGAWKARLSAARKETKNAATVRK